MENKIFGYKIPYTTNGNIQPYFKTAAARDSFLEKYLYGQLNSTGLAIDFQSDLTFVLTIALDITACEKINFIKVVYNNESYFGYVSDFSMVSVNRTELLVSRAPLYEVPDFHQYFELFFVTRKTVGDPLSFRPNNNYIINNPCDKLIRELDISFDTDSYYLLFLSPDVPTGPASEDPNPVLFVTGAGGTMTSYGNNETFYVCYLYPNAEGTTGNLSECVLALSAYILGYHKFNFLYDISTSDLFPSQIKYKRGGAVRTMMCSTILNFNPPTIMYSIENSEKLPLSDLRIRLGLLNDITIPLNKFASNLSNPVKIYTYPIISPSDCGYFIRIVGNSDSFTPNGYEEVYYLSSCTKLSFVLKGDAIWASQNSYYDAITQRKSKQITSLAKVESDMVMDQAFTQALMDLNYTGANYLESRGNGGRMASAWGGIARTVGNYGKSRAFAEYLTSTGEINSSANEDIRNLQANNDKRKPQGMGAYGDFYSDYLYNSSLEIRFFLYEPTDAYFSSYKKYLDLYGVECYYVEDTPTYAIRNNRFVYVATGLFKNSITNPINNIFAAYFQDILKKDFVYEVYQ